MAMPYKCKTCGSLEVYHHCIVRRPDAAVRKPSATIKVAVTAQPPRVVEQPPLQPLLPAPAAPAPTCKLPIIKCGSGDCPNEATKTMHGLRYIDGRMERVKGDRLCLSCYEELKNVVTDHIPCPPGWPSGYYVARLRTRKHIDSATAVTLLWCHGRLVRAAALKRSNRKGNVRVDTL